MTINSVRAHLPYSQIDEACSYRIFMRIASGRPGDTEQEMRLFLSGLTEDEKNALISLLIDEIKISELCENIDLFNLSPERRSQICGVIVERRLAIYALYANIQRFDLEDTQKKMIAESAMRRGDRHFYQNIHLFGFDTVTLKQIACESAISCPSELYCSIHLFGLDRDSMKEVADKLFGLDPMRFCQHLHLFPLDKEISKKIAEKLLIENSKELCNCVHLLDLDDDFRDDLVGELLKVNPTDLYSNINKFSLSAEKRHDIARKLFETSPVELCSVIDKFTLPSDVRLYFAKELIKTHPEVLCLHMKRFALSEAERIGLAMQLVFQDAHLLCAHIQDFRIADRKQRFMLYEMVMDQTQLEDAQLLSRFRLLDARQYTSNTVIYFTGEHDCVTPGAVPFKGRLEFLRSDIETRLIYDKGVYGEEAAKALAEGDERTRIYICDHGKPNSDEILSGHYKKVGDFIIANTPFVKTAKSPLRISLMTCESAIGGLHGEQSFAAQFHRYLSVSGVQTEVCSRRFPVAAPLDEGCGKKSRRGVSFFHKLPGSKLTFKLNTEGKQVIVDSYIEKLYVESRKLLTIIENVEFKKRAIKKLIKEISVITKEDELTSKKALLLLDKWKQLHLLMDVEQQLYKNLVKILIDKHEKSVSLSSQDPYVETFHASHG